MRNAQRTSERRSGRTRWAGCLCLAGLLLAISPAVAAGHREAGGKRRHHRLSLRRSAPLSHQVVIADQLVMVIDTADPGDTPVRRVDRINERLVEIVSSEPLLPSHMRLAVRHGETVIMVGSHLLVDVTPADARANRTTVPVLAHVWLANLKRILPQARPPAPLQ